MYKKYLEKKTRCCYIATQASKRKLEPYSSTFHTLVCKALCTYSSTSNVCQKPTNVKKNREILLNMLQDISNYQNMLQKKVLNKICLDPTFCHNVTKIPLKLTNSFPQYASLFTYISPFFYIFIPGVRRPKRANLTRNKKV